MNKKYTRRDKQGRFTDDRRLYKLFVISVGIVGAFVMCFVGLGNAYHGLVDAVQNLGHQGFVVENAKAAEPFVRSWKDDVLDIVEEAGIDKELARKIIQCESSWNPSAKNVNRNGSKDFGLWQINTIHKVPMEVMLDPVESTKWAIKKYQSGRGFQDWVCYTTGKYKR